MLRSPIAPAIRVDVDLGQHAAGRILRRIQNDQLRAIVDQLGELIDIEPEIHLLAQPDRHGFRADVIDHRFVNREPWIGIDDLIAFFDERQDCEKDDRLAAGNHDHFLGRHIYPACLTHILCDRLAQLRHTG